MCRNAARVLRVPKVRLYTQTAYRQTGETLFFEQPAFRVHHEHWPSEVGAHLSQEGIVEFLEPFLTSLLRQGLADKTLARHCDHLEMLGGEPVRRRQDAPDLAKQGVEDLLLTLNEEDGVERSRGVGCSKPKPK